jgi:hypothetical protein
MQADATIYILEVQAFNDFLYCEAAGVGRYDCVSIRHSIKLLDN